MNKTQARKFIKLLGQTDDIDLPDKGWHQFSCPFAPYKHENAVDSNPSMGVYIHPSKKSTFHCFACDTTGDAMDMAFELKGLGATTNLKQIVDIAENELEGSSLALMDVGDYDEPDTDDELFEYPDWFINSYPSVYNNPEAVQYLYSRGIWDDAIKFLDLRWSAVEERVVFPIQGFDGKYYGMHGRVIHNENPLKYKMIPCLKHTNPQVWLGEAWVDFDQPILVVESVFDLAKALQVYPNTVCPLRASISKSKIDRLAGGYIFVHCFDPDKAGDNASRKLREALPHALHKKVYLQKGKDPCDYSVSALYEVLEDFLPLDEKPS